MAWFIITDEELRNPKYNISLIDESREGKLNFKKILDRCSFKCRSQNCFSQTFEIRKYRYNLFDEFHQLKIRQERYSYSLFYEPKLSFFKYVLLLSSIIGLWSGFSVYSSMIGINSYSFSMPKDSIYLVDKISMLIYKYVWIYSFVFCFCAMIFHVSNNSLNYFSYKVENEVIYGTTHKYSLKENICFDIYTIIKWHRFEDDHSCWFKYTHGSHDDLIEKCNIDLVHNINLNDLIYHELKNPKKYISSMKLYDEKNLAYVNLNISHDIEAKFIIFFKYPALCLRLKHSDIDTNRALTDDIYYRIISQNLYSKKSILSFRKPKYIITDENNFPYSFSEIFHKFNLLNKRISFFNFKVTKSTTLPAPVTNCIQYDANSGYTSRDGCIDSCIRQKSHGLPFIQMIQFEPFPNQRLYQNGSHFKQLNSLCKKKCPIDCRIEIYEMIPFGYDSNTNYTGYAKRSLVYSTTVTYSLTMSLIEYIISLAEIHGLWFGLAIMTAGFEFSGFISNKLRKNKVVPSDQNNIEANDQTE